MPTKRNERRGLPSRNLRLSSDSDAEAVRQVRSFNRTVAERIGAVNDRFLDQRRPMNESRLIWEIGPKGEELRTLRMRLGLDSGYLTRVMGSLTKQGLARVRSAKRDGRVRFASLTRSGLRVRAEIDKRSDDLALHVLDVLTEQQREELTSAMGQVERLLEASMIHLAAEDPTSPDAIWCFEQYFAELKSRFKGGFDPARSISAEARELVAPHGALVIARLRGQPVGCGAVKFPTKCVAELKRMWVSPTLRGRGVGRRITHELERLAVEANVDLIRLETNRTLKEAIGLYRGAGYVEVEAFSAEPYAHHWFEKRLERASRLPEKNGRDS
jgi:DNA-binding MarR family transcriptional regulator/ribosomal protein S18 acetylase RimI-like enzyme